MLKTVLLIRNPWKVKETFGRLQTKARDFGLEISEDKIKHMVKRGKIKIIFGREVHTLSVY